MKVSDIRNMLDNFIEENGDMDVLVSAGNHPLKVAPNVTQRHFSEPSITIRGTYAILSTMNWNLTSEDEIDFYPEVRIDSLLQDYFGYARRLRKGHYQVGNCYEVELFTTYPNVIAFTGYFAELDGAFIDVEGTVETLEETFTRFQERIQELFEDKGFELNQYWYEQ